MNEVPPDRAGSSTSGWRIAFGIVLPVVCVLFDPLVFARTELFGYGYVEAWRIPCWFLIALEILAFCAVLTGRVNGPRATRFVAGLLFAGAAFSLVLGIVLLPFALMGLLAIIGALGLTPLFSSLTYFRTARHLLRSTAAPAGSGARWWVVAGFIAALLPASGIQLWVVTASDAVIAELQTEDPQAIERAMSRIDRFGFFLSAERVYKAALAEDEQSTLRPSLERAAEALGARFHSGD